MTVSMDNYRVKLRLDCMREVFNKYFIPIDERRYVNRRPGDYPGFALDEIEKEIKEKMFLDFLGKPIHVNDEVVMVNPSIYGGAFLIGVVSKLTEANGVTISLTKDKYGEAGGTRNLPPDSVVVFKNA